MPNNLKLRQLESFVAAADAGSFVAAAEAMAMTPPAFSQAIRELETTLGVALFERTTRRVHLTAAGQRLLENVRRPLADLSEVAADMRAVAGGERGRVSVAMMHSVAYGIGTTAIARLRVKRPEITVRIIEQQNEILIDGVRSREYDFGVGMFTEMSDDLTFSPLIEDELVAVFPSDHPFKREGALSWSMLAATQLILLQPKTSIRSLAEAGLLAAGRPQLPITEVVSMVTAANMAAAGLGVAILPLLSLSTMRMDGLVYRAIRKPRPIRHIGLIRRANRPASPAESLLTEEIITAAEELKAQQGR